MMEECDLLTSTSRKVKVPLWEQSTNRICRALIKFQRLNVHCPLTMNCMTPCLMYSVQSVQYFVVLYVQVSGLLS